METLPDYLDHGLDLVVIGQNPSPASIARRCYYGNPRNRFWPALRGAGLAPRDLEPGEAGLRWLLEHARIGFTDVVKTPTPGAGDLRAADFRAWAPVLAGHLRTYRPRIAWFNGKGVYQSFLRYGRGVRPPPIELGEQPETLDGSIAFVTPNPSPANAAFSLDDLTWWYRQVAETRERLTANRE
ncbi:MAG: mismatch-specific DNA-glycosylase [Halofilum sp. (in: g-proteobacteria)]|nr:mismatch-specific DNA-glycosylase [Halofilum sp. (in: g-proteobacteria)]